MDWSILVIIVQLIFLEGILSIDNAAVLGALVTPLPSDLKIPWPRILARLGHLLDPVLGHQRLAALRVGLLGAYLGRGLMLLIASFIIQNQWLKLIGAAYLIRLALDDLGSGNNSGEDEEGEGRELKKHTFWATVLTVELMDLAFSIDNVVAAVSLSDKLWVVILGVAIGILAMRYAAGIFSYLIEREPVLQKAAYILLLNIGVELILEDLAGLEISDWTKFAISLSTLLLAVAYARIPALKIFRPALVWLGRGFGIINELVSWLLSPLSGLVKLLWRGLRQALHRPVQAHS
jgi:tellurite resistance protein TerC